MSRKRKNNEKSNINENMNQAEAVKDTVEDIENVEAIGVVNADASTEARDVESQASMQESDVKAADSTEDAPKKSIAQIVTEHLKEVRNHFFHNYSKFERRLIIRIAVLAVVAAVAVYLVFNRGFRIEEKNRIIDTLNSQLAESQQQTALMQTQVDELNNQIQILSESFNNKAEEVQSLSQSETDSRVPSAYPLKGTAAIYTTEDANNNADDEDVTEVDEMDDNYGRVEYENDEDIPSVLFITGADTRVVSAGLGRVVSVSDDSTFGVCVEINHENGYTSIYRGYGVALVSEGDMVSQGCDIIRILDENTLFQYRVTCDNEYIDPMTCMEING